MNGKIDDAVEMVMQQLIGKGAAMGDVIKEAVGKGSGSGDPQPMKAFIEAVFNVIMLLERERHLEAGPHERTEARKGYANGFKHKRLDTTAGTLHLRVPKTAQRGKFGREAFYPTCIEKGIRCERALMAAIAEMYVRGVSTRRIGGLLKSMGVEGISPSQVSRAARALDEKLRRWRERPLGEVRYLQLDARYEKMRVEGAVRDVAVLTAVGVGLDGRRRVLGVCVRMSEAEGHWRDFLASLVARGLHGVEFVVSDDHAGLKAACRAVFVGAAWQRCQFHIAQNAISKAPTARIRRRIGADLREVWRADSAEAARAALDDLLGRHRRRRPALAAWLESSVPEGFGVFALPEGHRVAMRTSNPMERAIQQELKRRTRIIRIFPDESALLRLVSAVLMRIDGKWAAGEPYISWEDTDGRAGGAADLHTSRRSITSAPPHQLPSGRMSQGAMSMK